METLLCQRWRENRASYRPAGEPLRTQDYTVRPIASDTHARNFIKDHHYSKSYPSAVKRFGLYHLGTELVGVAVFSVPCNPKTLTNIFGGDPGESLELGRFVLLDKVEANGESWFLARCRHALKKQYTGLVSFSDPTPRTTSTGNTIFSGHIGNIYQASNAAYLGRSKARILRLLPDSTVLHERAQSKIRHRSKGYASVIDLLIRHGATAPRDTENLNNWLTYWRDQITRPLKHPGNLKYAWVLQGRHALQGGVYPKFTATPDR